jgi:DNA replication protein DnaC
MVEAEPITRISNLDSFLANIKIVDEPEKCPKCYGSGMEIIEGKGARTCSCIREKQRQKLIERFPERNTRFGVPKLENLKPFLPDEQQGQSEEIKNKILAWQSRIIRHVQTNPFKSLNLCGKNKIGKSQISTSLLLNAFDARRQVKFFKMKELLSDYAEAAKQSFSGMGSEDAYRQQFVPRLTVQELTEYSAKYTVLIDEFHNWILSSTESQFSTTFEILDAIKANRHQLILLSNYPFDWLQGAMHARKSKLGESVVYVADAIISRILEESDTDELFF